MSKIISAQAVWEAIDSRKPQVVGWPQSGRLTDSANGLQWVDVTEMRELARQDFDRAFPASVRRRLMRGQFESGADVAALRRFVGLTQARFARAMASASICSRIGNRNRRTPEGPAIALLRVAARHPRILRENLKTAA